mmetsp:Transcript_24138/g.72508  ORF Transcript_24138/g.72508 Transcript_24138/m.72508 type:complete len:264 (+) Transcript_24138:1077-1868(+)
MIFLHSLLSIACISVWPSSTKPGSAWPSSAECASKSLVSASLALKASRAQAMVVLGVNSAHDLAMSTAVSTLSPVNIQSLMPASLMVEIASGTPSCTRSSTAVTPMNFKPFSKRAATSATFSSLLSSIRFHAAKYSADHASYSALSMLRMPTTRVLKPCWENLLKSETQASANGFASKGSMTLSAPFVMHQMVPLCLATTDIRFRSALKASSCSKVNTRCESNGPLTRTSEEELPCLRTRLQKLLPTAWAAWTSATSSGDMPL